jgi:hypothetical protein
MYGNSTTKCNLNLQSSFWSVIYNGNSNVAPNKYATYMYVNDITMMPLRLLTNYMDTTETNAVSRDWYHSLNNNMKM